MTCRMLTLNQGTIEWHKWCILLCTKQKQRSSTWSPKHVNVAICINLHLRLPQMREQINISFYFSNPEFSSCAECMFVLGEFGPNLNKLTSEASKYFTNQMIAGYAAANFLQLFFSSLSLSQHSLLAKQQKSSCAFKSSQLLKCFVTFRFGFFPSRFETFPCFFSLWDERVFFGKTKEKKMKKFDIHILHSWFSFSRFLFRTLRIACPFFSPCPYPLLNAPCSMGQVNSQVRASIVKIACIHVCDAHKPLE